MKYAVIGGQYESYYYGTYDTLEEAKASRDENEEFHDNFAGFVKPKIYNFNDCEKTSNFYGEGYAPKDGAMPIEIDEDEE
jgi:hypothetical protein